MQHFSSICVLWLMLLRIIAKKGSFSKEAAEIECEEGKECVLQQNFSQSQFEASESFFWKTELNKVGECGHKSCDVYDNFKSDTELIVAAEDNQIVFTITINNISRDKLKTHGSNWSLSDDKSKILVSKILKIIANPKQLDCFYNATIEGLLINCTSSKSFPTIECYFSLMINEVTKHDAYTDETSRGRRTPDEYFITTCTARIPLKNIQVGAYNIRVTTTLRNVSKKTKNSANATISINIEKPTVKLEYCPSAVIEGNDFYCTCSKSDHSDIETTVLWNYDQINKPSNLNASLLLIKNIYKNSYYSCFSQNAFGWQSTKIYSYTPIVLPDMFQIVQNTRNKNKHVCFPYYDNDDTCEEEKTATSTNIKNNGYCRVNTSWSSACVGKHCSSSGADILQQDVQQGCFEIPCNTLFGLWIFFMIATVIIALIIIIYNRHINWKLILKKCLSFCSRQKYTEVVETSLDNPTDPALLAKDSYDDTTFSYATVKPQILDKNDVEWEKCKQLSGHTSLILCTDFMKNPKEILEPATTLRFDQIERYITSSIMLSVKLTVKQLSENRPLYLPKHSEQTGNCLLGTGIICGIIRSNQLCQCQKQDHQLFDTVWIIYIKTSNWVVFDDQEAKSTVAELFYHNNDKNEVKTVHGVKLYPHNNNTEASVIECETCDQDLCKRIQKELENRNNEHKNLPTGENTVAIISHPHGKPKYISFSSYTEEKSKNETIFTLNILNYTAAACPGTVGAPVVILNDTFKERYKQEFQCDFLVHSGCSQKSKLNYSNFNPINLSRKQNAQHEQNVGNDPNKPDVIVFEASEADLHVHLSHCKKNPNHSHFFPINDFAIEHLPPGYQYKTLLCYFKAIADICGRLVVKYTSLDRPEFYPGTKEPYACYRDRGNNGKRVGTATVISVVKSVDTNCECPECANSHMPARAFYLVYAQTATHVVFDDSEAQQCRLQLWYNEDNSLVCYIYGQRVVKNTNSTMLDKITVQFITHDLSIGEKLSNMLKELYESEIDVTELIRSTTQTKDKLTVIVSHPHGCSKMISFGNWVERPVLTSVAARSYMRYFYNTATCPGSSGAAIITFGETKPVVFRHLSTTHVQMGITDNDVNISSYGIKNYYR